MKHIQYWGRRLASLKFTTVILVLLAILTFFGTLDQAQHGLYAAQQKFFYSWLFRWYLGIPGTEYSLWFPFTGGALVLFLFTINLISAMIFHLRWTWKNSGLVLSHTGLLVLLLGGAWTHYMTGESAMTLAEGESKNYGESNQNWELAIWKNGPDTLQVYSRTLGALPEGKTLDFAPGALPFKVQIDSFLLNTIAYGPQPGIPDNHLISPSNIALIVGAPAEKEPQNNKAGLVLSITEGGKTQSALLHAFDMEPTVLRIGKDLYSFQLRRERMWIPFSLKLDDFRRELHGGTGMAKKYESLVSIIHPGSSPIQALVAMNQPLRREGYIFYQASFAQGEQAEISTFSVVQNTGRNLPYIASLMMGLGLLIHFMMRMRIHARRRPHEL